MRISLQPGYVLHSRPYKDTSSLLEVFTAEHGRVSLVGKGARRRSRGGSQVALLQPFTPLLLTFSGRAELKTLTQVEAAGTATNLRGERLYSGLYLNELLVRLLHRNDPHPTLFARYARAVEGLQHGDDIEVTLRGFELQLLDELGYRLDLTTDGSRGEELQQDIWYHYDPELGLIPCPASAKPDRPAYQGADLLQIGRGDLAGSARLTARRLMRQALAVHLGDAPLRSRELFRAQQAPSSPSHEPSQASDT
ncbi:DNA repair protein RecO [Halioglobus maricola]|uniref:DNA repair protein RecO n=1 Tax=Halioglobus maricola TaxID=2601894 RepID=A0A5P9NL86_9GAMM|nr:DNA repair protein RecO [Halioglobus maricola]QFU76512.1 DNA repair protein RecO [Halioglobus maricola]